MTYEVSIDANLAARLGEFAELVVLGRNAFYEASLPGFRAVDGSEASMAEEATQSPDWQGGPWHPDAAAAAHEVGLIVALSATGHLGEMRGLLETGEVAYSLPLLARGVLENCARLFAIYVRPLGNDGGPHDPSVWRKFYAAAYLEVIGAGFSAQQLAAATLSLDPSATASREAFEHADAELRRLSETFGPLFDPESSDVSSKGRLKLDGEQPQRMTNLLNETAEWMWPNPSQRPAPLYKVMSGYAHSSLDAQRPLYEVTDSETGRHLVRNIPDGHIEYNVAVELPGFRRHVVVTDQAARLAA